jgi:hypothetical protein
MTRKKPGPHPTVTDQVKKQLIESVQVGLSLADALCMLGISRAAFIRARQADPQFGQGIKSASSRGKDYHLRRIYRGDPGWQSSAWFLERKYGSEYGNRLKLDVEGELITRLVEEIVEPDGTHEDYHRNGQAAPGAAGVPT